MVTLDEYDAEEQASADLIRQARKLELLARCQQEALYQRAGVVWVGREAGFPCWCIASDETNDLGFFNTPREAVKAMVERTKNA